MAPPNGARVNAFTRKTVKKYVFFAKSIKLVQDAI